MIRGPFEAADASMASEEWRMADDSGSLLRRYLSSGIYHLSFATCHGVPKQRAENFRVNLAEVLGPGVRSVAGKKARPRSMMTGAGRAGLEFSRAAHAVAAVEAAVAGAAADGESAAIVAGGRVALEVGELAVLLA